MAIMRIKKVYQIYSLIKLSLKHTNIEQKHQILHFLL